MERECVSVFFLKSGLGVHQEDFECSENIDKCEREVCEDMDRVELYQKAEESEMKSMMEKRYSQTTISNHEQAGYGKEGFKRSVDPDVANNGDAKRPRLEEATTSIDTSIADKMLSPTMDEFNFDAPINATVIFDDSDDETKPVIDNLKKLEEGNKNTSKTETFNNSTKPRQQNLEGTIEVAKLDASKTETLNLHKAKLNSLDMPSLEDCSITSQDISGNSNKRSNVKVSDMQSNTDKQKQKNNERRKSTNVNTNKAEVQECNSGKMQIDQNVNLCCNPAASITETSLSILQKPNIETESQCTAGIDISQNLTQENNQQEPNADISLSQSLKIIDPTVSIYVKELLYSVSEHMVYIINSYHSYMKIYKNNLNQSLVEHAKNNFIRTKTHFFDLSYTSVLNIIVPRENDATFVKNFIDATVNIAHSKLYNYSIKHVEPLYYEMIKWVKARQDQIQLLNINKTYHPELYRQLQKPSLVIPPPPYSLPRTYKPSSNLNEHESINLLSSPEQNQNIESTHINKQNGQPCCPVAMSPQNKQVSYGNQIHNTQPMQNTSYRVNDYPQSLQTNAYTISQNTQESLKNQIYTQPMHMQHTSYRVNDYPQSLQTNAHNIPQQNTQETIKNLILNTQPMQNTSYTVNDHPQSLQTNAHKIPYQNTQRTLKKRTCNRKSKQTPSYRPYDSLQLLQNNVQNLESRLNFNDFRKADEPWQSQATQSIQKQLAQSWQNQAPTTQSLPVTLQELALSPNEQLHIPETPTQAEGTRSSISRDSGFTSPLNFNTSTEPMSNLQEEQSAQPLITHVTSLNPNVSYIIDGFCLVCGKTTKKKCLGCYKCYYCSHSCQYYDWKNHMAICK